MAATGRCTRHSLKKTLLGPLRPLLTSTYLNAQKVPLVKSFVGVHIIRLDIFYSNEIYIDVLRLRSFCEVKKIVVVAKI